MAGVPFKTVTITMSMNTMQTTIYFGVPPSKNGSIVFRELNYHKSYLRYEEKEP